MSDLYDLLHIENDKDEFDEEYEILKKYLEI